MVPGSAVFVGTGTSTLASTHNYIKQGYIATKLTKFTTTGGTSYDLGAGKYGGAILPVEKADTCLQRTDDTLTKTLTIQSGNTIAALNEKAFNDAFIGVW